MHTLSIFIILFYFAFNFPTLTNYYAHFTYIIASLGNTNLVFPYPVVFALLKTTLLL